MIRRFTMVCLIVTLALAGSVFAQGTQTATITGTVTGPDGAPLPGVSVTATSPVQIGGERSAVTGANGEYIIRGLTPGNYTVRFGLEGMEAVDRSVTAQLGLTSRVDATMRLTATAETIVVVGEAPSVLETTTVGANITKEQVDQLPVVRTPTGIASLAGAVTDRTPVGGQLSINGGMAYDNNFMVNGVNVQDPIFGSTNNLFIEDAILETAVLTSGISAEYGAFTGGVVNVITKSGGNDFSGSLRADLTKPEWRDETPWERGYRGEGVPRAAAQPRKGDLGEIYTGTLGGRIIRDRLWFFGAVRDEENTLPYVTPISGPVARVGTNRRIEGKLTGNITASHSLQASYVDNPVESSHEIQVSPLTIDAIGLNSVRENDGKVLSYNGVLTNNLFAEARWSEKHFGFRGLGNTATDIRDSVFYTYSTSYFQVPNAGTWNAPYFDATDPEDRDNESLFGALSYFLGTNTFGNHDLKGGVEKFTVTRRGGNSQSSTGWVFYSAYKVEGGVPVLDAQGRLIPVFNERSEATRWVPTRGAQSDVTTTAIFLNDRWDLNERFSFNIGIRHEIVDSESSAGIVSVDSSSTVPRLGMSFDPMGNGRFKLDATYSQYSGRYNPAITAENTPTGNPSSFDAYYAGPAGEGRDFAPGFDPANYVFYNGNVPDANVFMQEGLTSPTQHEYTLSGGMQLPRGGYAKLTFINRDLKDIIDNFITSDLGCTQVSYEDFNRCLDNVEFRNTNGTKREYRALELQGRYGLTQNWAVEGNYTRQLRNHGDYEGEGGQAIGATLFGNYPEIYTPRNNPSGRLSQFQRDKVRLWTTYRLGLGRLGSLSSGLIYRYDSPQVFSISAPAAWTAAQRAAAAGYSTPPTGGPSQTIFFGNRGEHEFVSTSLFDVSLTYAIPVFGRIEPWVKVDVRNVLNDDTQTTWNTAVTANVGTSAPAAAACGGPCPVDSFGLPTTYRKNVTFGRPTGVGSFVTPREYLVYAGIRF